MNQTDFPYKNIRYSRLHFVLRLAEDTEIVREKASAIRGGIGEMLLRANCIGGRDCEQCGFTEECIIQRILYSKFEKKPEFMQQGNSVGYIVYCPDKRKFYSAGEQLEFTLTLFGKTIVYLNQILSAVFALGVLGLGKNHSRFSVISIMNLYGESILQGNGIVIEKYKWQTLGEYTNWRRAQLERQGMEGIMKFHSPVTIKYQGEFIQEFTSEALGDALWRRLYILSAFESLEMSEKRPGELPPPQIISQLVRQDEVPRRSSRHDMFMKLKGIIGEIRISQIDDMWLDILLAGEIVHVGKNTSFGFGKYKIK